MSWDPYRDFRELPVSTINSILLTTTEKSTTLYVQEERKAEPMLAIKSLEKIAPNRYKLLKQK